MRTTPLFLLLVALSCSSAALAQPAAAPAAATITHLSGTVTARRDDGSPARLLGARSQVAPGETISTANDTYARMKFTDGTEVVLKPETRFKIEQFQFDEKEPQKDNMVFGLLKGGLRSVSGLLGKRSREKVTYTTATATVGIRGTHFGMQQCSDDCGNVPTVSGSALENGLHVDVASGAVVVSNAGGNLVFQAGQFGFVQNANSVPVIVPPNQGFRVTLPPNIAAAAGGGRSVGGAGAEACRP